jgi:uncharacterized membrane protein
MNTQPGIATTAALGALSGVRSLAPSALVAREFGHRPRAFTYGAGRTWLRRGLQLAALSEMVLDQSPLAPDRTEPLAIAERVTIGAILGATVMEKSRIFGAIVGGLSALAATYASFGVRAFAIRKGKAFGVTAGLLEDAFVFAAGRRLAHALP